MGRRHAFFTTTDPADMDTVAADKTHRGHAIIEHFHADLKDSALAHLPSVIWSGSTGSTGTPSSLSTVQDSTRTPGMSTR